MEDKGNNRRLAALHLSLAAMVHLSVFLFLRLSPEPGVFCTLPRYMYNGFWDETGVYAPMTHEVLEGRLVGNSNFATWEHKDDGVSLPPVPFWLMALLSLLSGGTPGMIVVCSALFPPLTLWLARCLAARLTPNEATRWVIAWAVLLSHNLRPVGATALANPSHLLDAVSFLLLNRVPYPGMINALLLGLLLSSIRRHETPTPRRRVGHALLLLLCLYCDLHTAQVALLFDGLLFLEKLIRREWSSVLPDLLMYFSVALPALPMALLSWRLMDSPYWRELMITLAEASHRPHADPWLLGGVLLPALLWRAGRNWIPWACLGAAVLIFSNQAVITGLRMYDAYYLRRIVNPVVLLFLAGGVAVLVDRRVPRAGSGTPAAPSRFRFLALAGSLLLAAFGVACEYRFARMYASCFRYDTGQWSVARWFQEHPAQGGVVVCWDLDLNVLLPGITDCNVLVPSKFLRNAPSKESWERFAWGLKWFGLGGPAREQLLSSVKWGVHTVFVPTAVDPVPPLRKGVLAAEEGIQARSLDQCPFRVDFVIDAPGFESDAAGHGAWRLVHEADGYRIWDVRPQ